MNIFITALILFVSLQLTAQNNRKTTSSNIEYMLKKAIDQNKKQAVTGITSVQFSGDSLTIKTQYFTIVYPKLDFSKFLETKVDENSHPTGFKTIWLYFSQEQNKYIDDKPQTSVKQFSVYLRAEDVSAFQASISSLATIN
jgi:hypothetical protein